MSSFQSQIRLRSSQPSASPVISNVGSSDAGRSLVSESAGAQKILEAVANIGLNVRSLEAQRFSVSELNSARSELISNTDRIMSDNQISPSDKLSQIAEVNESIMSGMRSVNSLNRFNVDSARHMSRVNASITDEINQLKMSDGMSDVNLLDAGSDFDDFVSRTRELSLPPLMEDRVISAGEKRFSSLKRISLSSEALSFDTKKDLMRIRSEVDSKLSSGIGSSRARFDVFGEAAKAAAQEGLIDKTDLLLSMVGDGFDAQKNSIARTARTNNSSSDRVRSITESLKQGRVQLGVQLSSDPKHLNSAFSLVDTDNVPTSHMVDSFAGIGLPMPPLLKDKIRNQFESGDVQDGVNAVNALRIHRPDDADRMVQELGTIASVAMSAVDRVGASAIDKSEAIEALSHPRAKQIVEFTDVLLNGDKKLGIDSFDPSSSLSEFAGLEVPVRFTFGVFNNSSFNSELTGSQAKGLQDQFRLKVLQQSIRDDVSTSNLVGIRTQASKAASKTYMQNFDGVIVDGKMQLLSKSLLINQNSMDKFRESVAAFEVFSNAESPDSRVLANRAFVFGESVFAPSVDDSGSIVGFMRFNRDDGSITNMSNTVNQQGFEKISRVFASTIKPGETDLYADVRRRPGEPDVAFDAGSDDRVSRIVRIAIRRFEIDHGVPPGDEDDEEFQSYLDDATARSGFKSLMPTGRINNANIPGQ